MKRLAWFTPLPPERSGIATYSSEILGLLTDVYDVDIIVDSLPLQHNDERHISAYDFSWRQIKDPYDLIVYQLGNARCHDYIWPYMFRYPGLVVLHDGQLHQARARLLLQQKRYEDYRAEFEYNHPDARADIAYLGIAGLLGSLHYLWPMLRTVVNSARMVAVHNTTLVRELQDRFPEARIDRIRMGVPDASDASRAKHIRARHNISQETVVFAAFGRVTPEKRIAHTFRALAAIASRTPHVHLLIVGEPVPYYDAIAEAKSLGVSDRVTFTGYVEDRDLDDYIACADACLCMRWPSSGETSASWLRCLAGGRATIVTDLHHTIDVPALVTRGTWTPSPSVQLDKIAPIEQNASAATGGPSGLPLCVSIDIMDEENSLQVAMERLARDRALRRDLGNRAKSFWAAHHTLKHMQADYLRVISLALDSPTGVTPPLPHLRPDGLETARDILKDMGMSVDILGSS